MKIGQKNAKFVTRHAEYELTCAENSAETNLDNAVAILKAVTTCYAYSVIIKFISLFRA